MVATKMFWDMWRNLTNATSNWTISTSSSLSKSKSSRYNRLRSPPTKSCSQPANLAGFTSKAEAETSCLRFLDNDDDDEYVGVGQPGQQHQENRCMDNINVDRTTIIPKKSTIKHSITTTSFLPFSSFRAEHDCTSKRNGNTVVATTAAATGFEKAPTTKYPQSTQVNSAKGIICNKGGSNCSSSNTTAGGIPIRGATEKDFPTLPMSTTSISSSTTTANTGNQYIRQQKAECCVVGNDIPDLDDDETDPDAWDHVQLQCDVCDRNFATYHQLADHQRKKRHYGCLQCDTLFPTQEGLDIHREQMCHYEFAIDMAGYRDYGDGQDGDDDSDSFVTDDDENGFGYSDDGDDEEMERLL